MAEIVVGQRNSSGTITRGNLAKDYIYRTVIKLVAASTLEPPPAVCPDGVCTPGEDCLEDCHGYCGDEVCNPFAGETNESCSVDCPPVCGDDFCSPEENDVDCPEDCLYDQDCVKLFCTNFGEGIVRECNSNADCQIFCDENGYCSNDGSKCDKDSDCF
jgi:hypothetical protein